MDKSLLSEGHVMMWTKDWTRPETNGILDMYVGQKSSPTYTNSNFFLLKSKTIDIVSFRPMAFERKKEAVDRIKAIYFGRETGLDWRTRD